VKRSLSQSPVSQYEVHALALGDRDGEIDLIVPRGYSGSAGLHEDFSGVEASSEIKVPIRRFDTLVDGSEFLGNVVVKLDIEGAEVAFLRGASKMIKTRQPAILMEINPRAMKAAGTTLEEMTALLQSLSYTEFSETHTPAELFPLEKLTPTHRNIFQRPRRRENKTLAASARVSVLAVQVPYGARSPWQTKDDLPLGVKINSQSVVSPYSVKFTQQKPSGAADVDFT
jgi:FkbM family methyltransferase